MLPIYCTKLSLLGQYSRLCRIVTVFLLLLLSAQSQAQTTEGSQEPNLDNVSSPTLFLQSAANHYDAPVLESTVDVGISGMIANVEISQSFVNSSTDWVEGLYTFPLPDRAVVNSLVVSIGDRRIVGSIQEKKLAEVKYEEAKRAGKVASLVRQHRPNMFSSKFANIPPGETVTIELGYVQTVPLDNHTYSLRVPLTLTPRYSTAVSPVSIETNPPQIALPKTDSDSRIKHRVSINPILFGKYSDSQISSPSHELELYSTENETVVQLSNTAYLDRDFILQWREEVESVPSVQAWRETVAGEEYLLTTIQPPINSADIPRRARELILVIDTSGSMAGESMRAAKAALMDALHGLQPQDRFNIIEFDSEYSTLFSRPQVATDDNIDKAREFTQSLVADGGTEILDALQTALSYRKTESLRQVVFITDGAVDYEESVFKSAQRNLGDARVFTVAIGSAPNEWFMRKLAQTGRGAVQFIHDVRDVEKNMSVLLKKLETPVLTNISVSFDGKMPDIAPSLIPDLYANEPLVIAAKLSEGNSTMTVTGSWGAENWNANVLIGTTPSTNTGLSGVWAGRKIEELQDKQRFSTDPDLYRSLILRLSLDHQILSPYTAFLAIEETPIRPVNEGLVEKTVPNILPVGLDTQSFALPQGSLGIDTLAWLSVLLSLGAWVFSTRQRGRDTKCTSHE